MSFLASNAKRKKFMDIEIKKLKTEAPLGISLRSVNQIFEVTDRLKLGSAVLISKILGVSIDTPDTPLTGPL